MSNTYLHLREEQEARLNAAMNAPIEHKANALFNAQLDKARPACSGGSCRQGHARCQTPEACCIPIDETGGIVDLCWVIFAVALLCVPLFAAVFFVADNWSILSALWRSL